MKKILILWLFASCLGPLAAQDVKVAHAWARATVPQQKASGAFMDITASANMKLVGATTPLSRVTEIHEMTLRNNVMNMSAIAFLSLPAQQTVSLKPGGYHLMFLDLIQPLKADSTLPLTLSFQDENGRISKLAVEVMVKPLMATQPNQSSKVHHH